MLCTMLYVTTCVPGETATILAPVEILFVIHQVDGAINDVASNATAYLHRDTEFIVTVVARWEGPTKDDQCIDWVQE